MNNENRLEGSLQRQTTGMIGKFQSWKRWHCELVEELLTCRPETKSSRSSVKRDVIDLSQVHSVRRLSAAGNFQIATKNGKTLVFAADSEELRSQWISSLQLAMGAKRRSQLRQCFSEDDARTTVYSEPWEHRRPSLSKLGASPIDETGDYAQPDECRLSNGTENPYAEPIIPDRSKQRKKKKKPFFRAASLDSAYAFTPINVRDSSTPSPVREISSKFDAVSRASNVSVGDYAKARDFWGRDSNVTDPYAYIKDPTSKDGEEEVVRRRPSKGSVSSQASSEQRDTNASDTYASIKDPTSDDEEEVVRRRPSKGSFSSQASYESIRALTAASDISSGSTAYSKVLRDFSAKHSSASSGSSFETTSSVFRVSDSSSSSGFCESSTMAPKTLNEEEINRLLTALLEAPAPEAICTVPEIDYSQAVSELEDLLQSTTHGYAQVARRNSMKGTYFDKLRRALETSTNKVEEEKSTTGQTFELNI